MTETTITSVAQAPAPAGRPGSAFSLLLDVVLNPHVGFRNLVERPVWLLPLLLWSALNLAANFVLLNRLDFGLIVRNQVEQAGGYITDQQVDEVAKRSRESRPVTLLISAVAPAAVALVVATAFWLSLLAFGTMTSFRKAFAATAYAFVPQCVAMLLTTVLTMRFDRIESIEQSARILRSHLGAFWSSPASPAVMSLLQSFDVFSLWTVALLGIGFSAVSGRRKLLTVSLAYGFWGAYVALKVGMILFTSR